MHILKATHVDGASEAWVVSPRIFTFAVALGVVNVLSLCGIEHGNANKCQQAHRKIATQSLGGHFELVSRITVSLS